MSAGDILLVVVSGLGVIHGLFLAIFLLVYQKGNTASNKLLAFLLLVLSFRVGKSVFLEFTENLDVKFIFIGLGTLMAIGPLFYLFTRSRIDKYYQPGNLSLLHFIPAFLGVCFGAWLEDKHLETLPLALFATIFIGYYVHYLVYIILAYRIAINARKEGLSDGIFNFIRLLFIGLVLIWFAYVTNLFDDMVPYIIGPIFYSLVAYVVSFIVIKKGYIQLNDPTKYKTTQVSDEQIELVFEKAEAILIKHQGYKDDDLSLKSMSDSIGVSTQVLSMVINQKSGGNFNNFVNRFRVIEASRLFRDPAYQNFTIAAIAFEVGFKSLSSFNTAFKKQTGKTPQAFRNNLTK